MKRNYFNRWNIIFFLIAVFYFLCVPSAFANLTINIIAVNASENAEEIDVKYYLPVELKPGDILDPGELQVDYDVGKGTYFVQGKVQFQPKESKTFKVKVRDVWVLDVEEINGLKKQLDESLNLLAQENYENYDMAQAVRDRLVNQLDSILKQQETYSEDIDRRIEEYRSRATTLRKLRTEIYDPNFLKNEAFVGAQIAAEKTIKLVIEVQNPSQKREKTVKHKHYLPKEVRARDIVDPRGFEIRFDPEKERSFLTKEETFLPSETRKYEISIRDIWFVPLTKVDALERRGEYALKEIRESAYFESGEFLLNEVKGILEKIRTSQAQETSIKRHIGVFRVNEERYQEAEDKVQKIEKMMAIVKEKKLKEYEKRVVKNVLKKLRALRGVAELSEALFKKGVSVTTTWRVIMAVLAFVFMFTAGHFFRWSLRAPNVEEGEGIKEVPKPGAEGEEKEE